MMNSAQSGTPGLAFRCAPCGLRRKSEDLPRPAQPGEQFGGRPGIGRQAELDLHLAHRAAALQAEDAVGFSDVVAALLEDLLQLTGFIEAELGNVAAAPHDRR